MSKYIYLAYTLFFTLWTQQIHANECLPSTTSCDYYVCAEMKMNCGKNGYIQSFGYPRCEYYREYEQELSPKGQKWSQQIRKCLQQEIENSTIYTCEDLYNLATESHVKCYVQTGFCELNPIDVAKLGSTVLDTIGNKFVRDTIVQVNIECFKRDVQKNRKSWMK